ncbi:MAG TPA: DUF3618 domain-containing protein [Gammaproteobacteria bacterium]
MNHETTAAASMEARRHNGDRSPDEIEADLNHTRARMEDDLAALEDRLSPGHLIDEALGYLRTGGAADYFHNLGETAKRNPIPLALVSTGLAWLALSGRSGNSGEGDTGTASGQASSEYGFEGAWQSDAEYGVDNGSLAEDMKAKAGQSWDRTASGAGAAVNAAKDKAHRVAESTRQGMHSAREQTRRRAEQAREGARRAGEYLREQPLIGAGIALAIGAILGGLLPSSRREDELMGSHSDALKDSVKRGAESLLREGEQRLEETASAAEQTSTGESQRAQSRPPQGEPVTSVGSRSVQQNETLAESDESGGRLSGAAAQEDGGGTFPADDTGRSRS